VKNGHAQVGVDPRPAARCGILIVTLSASFQKIFSEQPGHRLLPCATHDKFQAAQGRGQDLVLHGEIDGRDRRRDPDTRRSHGVLSIVYAGLVVIVCSRSRLWVSRKGDQAGGLPTS
jgi:hypothetical protein